MPRLPAPSFGKHAPGAAVPGAGAGGGATSIPLPSTANRRAPPPQQNTGNAKSVSSSSSRSTSPCQAQSLIPTPRSGTRTSIRSTTPPTTGNRSSLRAPSGNLNSPYTVISNNQIPGGKNDMLDKLKIFNSKEKIDQVKSGNAVSKRTSSSSGFSSAKSEQSDSSTSLCSDVKPSSSVAAPTNDGSSPKTVVRGLKNKLAKGNSPKSARKNDSLRQTNKPVTKSVVDDVKVNRLENSIKETNFHYVELDNPIKHSKISNLNQPKVAKNNSVSGPNSNIPKPMAAIKGTSKTSKEENNIVTPIKSALPPRQKQLGWDDPSSGNISIAMVSPMPNLVSAEAGSKMSESSNSNSNSTGRSNSSDSSVIFQPSSESGSDVGKPATKIIETTFDNIDKVITQETRTVQPKETTFGEEEESMMNVKPMQPLLRGYTGGLLISGRSVPPSVHVSPMSILNDNCTSFSPKMNIGLDFKRGMGDGGYGENDYSDLHLASGYLSDGEMMRGGAVSRPLPDICDGYMSEGGASLYARRQMVYQGSNFQTSTTNFNISGTETSNRGKPRRFDDSTLAEDSVADIYNSENHTANNSNKHQQQKAVQSNKIGGCSNKKSLTPPFSPSDVPQVLYRVVGSRSHAKKADSSQQTDYSAFRQVSNTQWKKYAEVGLQRGKSDLEVVRPRSSPSNGQVSRRPEKNADKLKRMGVKDEVPGKEKEYAVSGEKTSKVVVTSRPNGEGKSSGKVRGVPQSFGYVKRPSNGGGKGGEARTAQVAAVPRTKLKVSGGTQTCSADLQQQHQQQQQQHQQQQQQQHYKLSQNVRDRLLLGSQSLPPRPTLRPTDGSLSDTTAHYTELQGYSPYSSWLRHSSTYTASLPARTSAAGLVEADSVESLCSLPAQLQHRASLTHTRLLMHQREGSGSPVLRLNRSNSIRSTKSEKLYPSMLQRSEELEPYYCVPLGASQPTSPTPSQVSQGTASRFNYPVSPITSSASSHVLSRTSMSPYSGLLSKTNSKDDEVHGSSVSLVSTASSLYSTAEEKQAHEIRKLRRELMDAQEKVHTLTSQLSTNAHVVSAFEQSLSSMTQRLQHLTSTAERKDSELLELRQTIELLRKQSVEAGLTSAHLQSLSPSLARRHTINAGAALNGSKMSRQLSADSVSSINSLSSACSLSSSAHAQDGSAKKKKKGWLRSSFSKAFSRSKKNKNGSVSDVEDSRGLHSDVSAPSSPLLNNPHQMNTGTNGIKGSLSSSAIYGKESQEASSSDVVEELKKQLREKDLVLTDIRLEALSSAHQLESLKDTVIKMRNEMLNLKQDNERLQRIVTSKSLTSSQSSLPITDSLERRFSMTETSTIPVVADGDGKRVLVSVLLGSHGSYHKYMEEGSATLQCVIAAISVSTKIKWDILDCMVRRVFKEYVLRVDPVSNLGLSADSLWSYHIGEVVRYKDSAPPELLPCGYLVGNSNNIVVCLKGALHSGSVDALAFETLIPKSIVQRYVSLLMEHRRIILCGPSGTGKSYLANKLAEFLVLNEGKESTAEAIATFNVDHKSSKELRQYLANVAEQCETNASDLPSVIILDNLHHAASLGEVFNGFLNAKYSKCPYIIGTMNQATCSTTNLQLHHNFRWVLCANHMEPVKGFLGRYLRRRLLEVEVHEGIRNNDLTRIFDWIPKVWQHLNKFLETHSSSDVTIGPRLFLSCPSNVAGSQVWFTDLWNYSVVPYLLEAVREGLQLYGRRAPWEDPTHFICQSYPWMGDIVQGGCEALLRLRPEDVGYDIQQGSGIGGSSIKSMSSTQSDTEGDPLLNMLMRLQEAANYSSPHSNDSDSGSCIRSDEKGMSRVESTL